MQHQILALMCKARQIFKKDVRTDPPDSSDCLDNNEKI